MSAAVTFVSVDPTNLAICSDVWTLTIEQAKAVAKVLKAAGEDRSGGMWRRRACTPIRRAVRSKAQTVTIYTAGFSTSEFANYVAAAGYKTECVN